MTTTRLLQDEMGRRFLAIYLDDADKALSPLDALILRVAHGDRVSVAIEGDARGLIFNNVAVRVSPDMRLEMHIDTDEANAAGADNPQVFARLVGPR